MGYHARQIQTDYSTLNVDELIKLPTFSSMGNRESDRVSEAMGSGCFLNPPGYPSYFIQNIYNKSGNTPHHGAEEIIYHPEAGTRVIKLVDDNRNWDARTRAHDELMRKLWVPLPLDHPRTQAWIISICGYFNGTWLNPEVPEATRRDVAKLICKSLTEESLLSMGANRYRPVDYIRGFYPDHQFDMMVAKTSKWGKGGPGGWWETQRERPSPKECDPCWGQHPMNQTWRQWCGWEAS